VTTQLLCRGNYRIVVAGANCTKSQDFFIGCNDCNQNTAALSGVSFDCDTNQLFLTISADACTTSYNVKLLNSSLAVVHNQTYTNPGAKTIPLGTYPGDGSYIVRLTANTCVTDTSLGLNCNGTASPCPLTDGSTSLSYTDDSVNVSFTAGFTLTEAGGTYKVTLQSTTGGSPASCNAAIPDAEIDSVTVVGALGSNIVNFPDAVAVPGSYTCYGVTVQKLGTGFASCNDFDAVLFIPSAPAPSCSIEVTNLSYDTATGNILVSWNGEETSHDLTVEIRVSATPCNAADPIVVNIDGNGEDGTNIPFGPVHQINAVAQCATVRVYDTNDPTCYGEDTLEIAACTCAIVIDDSETVVDNDNETIEVTYSTRCTSGDITLDISGDATGSAADATASTTGVAITNTKVIALTGYPSTGGSVVVELIDDVDGTCSDTQTVALPNNCASCAQIAALFDNTSTLTQIRNHAGSVVVTGSYDVVTDEADIETDTEAEIVADGGNFCETGTPVDVANTRAAGIAVNQDDSDYQSLDHVLVENVAWASTKKFYFTDCGCGIARRCTYTANLPISATADQILLVYAVNDSSLDYMNSLGIGIATPQTFSASALTAIETAIYDALTGTSCNSDVTDVTATYDSGTDILTIVITGTNAGLGVIHTYEGSAFGDFVDFTQSACA
jgi:hypothetical protein